MWCFFRGTFLLVAFACALCAVAQEDPSPQPSPPAPSILFPPNWQSWCVFSITTGENLTWARGQNIVYSSSRQIGCRFNVQNLINKSKIEGMAFCDYQAGMRYVLNDTRGDPPCASQSNFGSGPIPQLGWPDNFLQSAKFIGIDRVGDFNCYHYYTFLSVSGKDIQFDAWTSVDSSVPCKISYFQKDSGIYYAWAFEGFKNYIADDAWKCSAAKIQCSQKGWHCKAKPGSDPDFLGLALHDICDPTIFDCSPINPGGKFFEPNTVSAHVDWALDAFFQANKMSLGDAACDFRGVAQLVPPSTLSNNINDIQRSDLAHVDDLENVESMSVLDAWPLFLNDIVCPGLDSPQPN